MLKLKNIVKDYKVADFKVHALKGVSLNFRQNEFVAVLGPSGCGKTTLLNIVGGLDKYTKGDLFIKGKSTKSFKDKDWDIYRNHRIGFVFQSYNLIPHQSVLANVELSLAISGMSKAERVQKSIDVLDKVGLQGEYYKRPNQLSGGQSQRVAIARALVNDPEILLADEPTGALDSETSIQIMDLMKEIAKDRLVIMVTHNPNLANTYANRIVNLLDGEVLSDSNPYLPKDEVVEEEDVVEKSKMSFFTAFKLSLKNLFTKKARTILTSIAGSIGIIGVSLVLSLSNGLHTQIANMQNDMLSSNPIEITKQALDISQMQNQMRPEEKQEIIKKAGYVNIQSMVDMIVKRAEAADGIMVTNEITENYINYIKEAPVGTYAAFHQIYGFDLTNNLYTDVYEDKESESSNMSLATLRTIYTAILKETEYAKHASLISTLSETFSEVIDNEEYIMSQYEFLDGNHYYPRERNEIMIVLSNEDMLNDLLLAQLGYLTQEQFLNLIDKASESNNYDESIDIDMISYEDLLNKEFIWYDNDTVFKMPNNPLNAVTHNGYYDSSFEEGIPLKITGIIRPKDSIKSGSLRSGFYYTKELKDYIYEKNYKSEVNEYLRLTEQDGFYGMEVKREMEVGGNIIEVYKDLGIKVSYNYNYNGEYKEVTSYLGKVDPMSSMMGMFMGQESQEIVKVSINQLAGSDLPFSLKIYSKNFEEKEMLIEYLDKWNDDGPIIINGVSVNKEDREKIVYTDNLSLIFSIMSSLINVITIALIGFTSLSLVVSSVMIAIITYVSVVERTKEIGVIRSLGGRKKDVSRLFNAETFIIGIVSGTFGIIMTYLFSMIINLIVVPLVGMKLAIFAPKAALIMLLVSVTLTVISGLVPARSAAKKDPVVALRTE